VWRRLMVARLADRIHGQTPADLLKHCPPLVALPHLVDNGGERVFKLTLVQILGQITDSPNVLGRPRSTLRSCWTVPTAFATDRLCPGAAARCLGGPRGAAV
jgi:hypothetical protein